MFKMNDEIDKLIEGFSSSARNTGKTKSVYGRYKIKWWKKCLNYIMRIFRRNKVIKLRNIDEEIRELERNNKEDKNGNNR